MSEILVLSYDKKESASWRAKDNLKHILAV